MKDRITALTVSAYEIPLDAAESDGTLTWDATSVVVVEVAACGTTGLGYSYATVACAPLITKVLEPIIVGADPFDVPSLWSQMAAAVRNFGRPGIASTAIAAVDTALWDLKAKLLDLPLCRLLGQARRDVPIYGSGGFTNLRGDVLTEQLRGWVDAGIPRVKMKVGVAPRGNLTDDISRVRDARDAIDAETELYVDANGAYSRKQAVRAADAFEQCNVTWFEEPVSSDDLAGLHEVRNRTTADVAAGEYGYDLVYFERMAEAAAVDVIQADATRCGGFTGWLRVAALAAAHNLELSCHCAPMLHLHVACTVPNIRHIEYFADHVRAAHLLFEGCPAPIDGSLRPDLSRAGIGLALKRADAAEFAVEV